MITLRKAEIADCEMVREWRNEPFVYNAGRSKKTVTETEHRAWFQKQVSGIIGGIFIVVFNSTPVGLVRYELNRNLRAVEISVFFPERNTRKGYGPLAIRQCCEAVQDRWPGIKITAEILGANIASAKAFIRAGFRAVREGVMEFSS